MVTQVSPPRTATQTSPRIESLLSNRLFLAPQLVADRLYFISNMSGHMSLYAMNRGGSVPEPLLPPDIALQNPELIGGKSFYVFPELGQIVVMIDRDGDEKYQPMVIPVEGGIPAPAFGDHFAEYQVFLGRCDTDCTRFYLTAASRHEALMQAYAADLETRELEKLYESQWGCFVDGVNADHSKVTIIESYLPGDHVIRLWERGKDVRVLYGTPLAERTPGQEIPPNSIGNAYFTEEDRGLLFSTSLFEDTFGLGYLDLTHPGEVQQVTISGTVHRGAGEMDGLNHLDGTRFNLNYNIDGASWAYEGTFDEAALEMRIERVLIGQGELANGTAEALSHDAVRDGYALSFSTATSPTQLYTLEGPDRTVRAQTRERVLGIPQSLLSPGEDASFTSHDGLRISARLYLPSPDRSVGTPYPLVYYIHGGPQGQERPNFAWFSMPLIQFLTLHGFAVFVPNVRGSTGYGLSYMKQVDHDWGGKDRLDHVHAMTEVLPKDTRLDVRRAGVMGRSYGGYMTLLMASRHADLWKAAVDMFGPYNLITFGARVPETWKPYIKIQVGDPETERDFLLERSPQTYFDGVRAPLFVIQGKNDPRVVEQESRDVVENLRARGKEVEYLMFENEGHDVLKYENRVRCYSAITEFFEKHLQGA